MGETWNSTRANLALLRARIKALIHGTDILRPHPTDEARKGVLLLKDTPHPASVQSVSDFSKVDTSLHQTKQVQTRCYSLHSKK